jgi:hypothetical protein
VFAVKGSVFKKEENYPEAEAVFRKGAREIDQMASDPHPDAWMKKEIVKRLKGLLINNMILNGLM